MPSLNYRSLRPIDLLCWQRQCFWVCCRFLKGRHGASTEKRSKITNKALDMVEEVWSGYVDVERIRLLYTQPLCDKSWLCILVGFWSIIIKSVRVILPILPLQRHFAFRQVWFRLPTHGQTFLAPKSRASSGQFNTQSQGFCNGTVIFLAYCLANSMHEHRLRWFGYLLHLCVCHFP